MSEPVLTEPVLTAIEQMAELEIAPPDYSHIVTEDDKPVDNINSERGQRLLAHSAHAGGWSPAEGRTFLAFANVGLYYGLHLPPVVPDVFLSLDVKPIGKPPDKQALTYMVWEHGKVPEVVIEIVSNRKGEELGTKKGIYARIRVAHYIVYDPLFKLDKTKKQDHLDGP